MSQTIEKYFPQITPLQQQQFDALPGLYSEWNAKINVISRQDIGQLEIRHVLHSLSIANTIRFAPGTSILDIGTGGGFPGIPLAILFPDVTFVLADSIGKKVRVVEEIARALALTNVKAIRTRVENMEGRFDFITGRAVASLPDFLHFAAGHLSKKSFNDLPNGILYLKGGEMDDELKLIRGKVTVFNISDWFSEPFFETKKLIYIQPFKL
ncbi:MAG TPA: 16S rRNA (guanine(527)-N(7))-methyltransferase RsmG [Bacteroidales bacterium]|nr:16S rRNA (guanine(527)-N(7))-methyltransferase RsmG [Bacteroidales bacterium]